MKYPESAEWVRGLQANLTNKFCWEHVGCDQRTWFNWKSGTSRPTEPKFLEKLKELPAVRAEKLRGIK